MEQQLPRDKASEIIDFTDLSEKSFENLLSSVLAEKDMKRFTPDGVCRIDPRTGIRVIYSEKRAKRPHDNKPAEADEPASAPVKPCPVCEGKTTRILDIADLSEGYTFINKNLFPILYPDMAVEKDFDFLYPEPSGKDTAAYGMHFLQWPSNFHERDFNNMPVEDSAVILERMSVLEEKMLHSSRDEFPDTSAFEDEAHIGYSGIIKHFGALFGV